MTKNAGLWIDNKQAIIVFPSKGGESIKHLKSDADKHHSAHEGGGEDKHERRFAQQLHGFFEEVIDCVKNVESVFVFGPGEAKTELNKVMAKDHRLDKCKIKVESSDKMTEHQVAAKVRDHFDKNHSKK